MEVQACSLIYQCNLKRIFMYTARVKACLTRNETRDQLQNAKGLRSDAIVGGEWFCTSAKAVGSFGNRSIQKPPNTTMNLCDPRRSIEIGPAKWSIWYMNSHEPIYPQQISVQKCKLNSQILAGTSEGSTIACRKNVQRSGIEKQQLVPAIWQVYGRECAWLSQGMRNSLDTLSQRY